MIWRPPHQIVLRNLPATDLKTSPTVCASWHFLGRIETRYHRSNHETDDTTSPSCASTDDRSTDDQTGLLQRRLPGQTDLRQDPRTGEGHFTRKAISIADAIFTIPLPELMATETEKLWSTCYNCLVVTHTQVLNIAVPFPGKATLRTCMGCNQVRFCSEQCQTQAWNKFHKH
jgi:hypothetical protein